MADLQQVHPDSKVASSSTPLQPSTNIPPGRGSRSRSHLPNGIYHIINVTTGAYAALLSDTDRLEVVNITFNLNDDDNRGSQWSITHLGQDQYKIQNVDFASFAGYDTGSQVEDPVLGKSKATTWTIRLAQSPNIYTVSPTENPDIFWMSLSKVHGTPLEFGQPSTARRCRWIFKAIGSPAEPQPYHLYAGYMADLNSLLEKLPTVHGAQYDADPRPRCVKGTRVELLQDIQNWVADPASTPIFWLRGRAGTGKTTVSLTVADECDRREQLGASFIFSRDQAERSELRHVFPTIAHQLARLHEPYKALLGEALSNNAALASLQPPHLLKRLIVEPLARCESFPSPIIVVIDALDECKDQNPVSTLLDILKQHIDQLRQLKFFITSRPEPHIEAVFTVDLRRETTSITLHDIETTKVDVDIALFIRTALANGAKAYPDLIQEGWPSEENVLGVVKRSRHLFVFASTVARAVFDDEFGDPKARLAEILASPTSASISGEALDQLDNLYLCTLQITSSEPSRPDVIERLQKILGAILTVANPLSPSQLEGLLDLGQGRVRAALRRLHSVLVVPDTVGDPIRLVHPSFFDFLTVRCKDDRFRIDAQVHHRRLAIRCFELMYLGLKRNICQLSDSSKLNNEVEDLEERIQRFIPPSLQYACRYWPVHICGSDGEVLSFLERFASEQMLYWIEVLGLLGLLREGTDQLLAAQSFLMARFPEESKISNLFRDGRRFISAHYEVICSSALHIYISAFGFLPHSSLLKQTYEGHIRDSLRAVQGDSRDLSTTRLAHGQHFRSPSFSSDGAYVSAFTDQAVWIWHAGSASLFSTIQSDHQPTWSQFLPDNAHIVCGYINHTLVIWDIKYARSVDTIPLQPDSNPSDQVEYAADAGFSILGMLLDNQALRLWDTRTWQLQREYVIPYKPHPSTNFRRVISFKLAAVSSQALHVAAILIQADEKNTVHVLPDSIEYQMSDIDNASCFSISPDGRKLAVGTQRCEVTVYDTRTNQPLKIYTYLDTFPDHYMNNFPSLHAATFPNNGADVLFVTSSGILSWPLAGGGARFMVSGKIVTEVSCSKSDQLLFTDGSNIFLKAGEYSGGGMRRDPLSGVLGQFTPDGSRVVKLFSGEMVLFNIGAQKFDFPSSTVSCAASSPDSQYIIIGLGEGDYAVMLYTLGTKGKSLRLYKHRYPLLSVGCSQDGRMVISVDAAGAAYIWDLRHQHLLYWFELLDARLDRPLGSSSSSPIRRLLARFDLRNSRHLEMPLASSLPSPIWRIGNRKGSRLWQELADVWGFGYIPLDPNNSEALLYCKSRATVVHTVAACGATHDQVQCGTGPPLEITTSCQPVLRGDGDGQATASSTSTILLHYHNADNWVMACRGAEARRYAWLPPEWRYDDPKNIPISNLSNRNMIIPIGDNKQVLLDLTGLFHDLG